MSTEHIIPEARISALMPNGPSPLELRELVRGYALARAAGLLGDGKINPEVAIWYARLGYGYSNGERIEGGIRMAAAIRRELAKASARPDGIPLVNESDYVRYEPPNVQTC